MTHVSIKVVALNFMKSCLFPKEIYTFAKMNHVIIQVNFVNFDKLYINALYFLRKYTHLRR